MDKHPLKGVFFTLIFDRVLWTVKTPLYGVNHFTALSAQVAVLVEHVRAQAAALAEVLLAVPAREGPLARVAALVPVEVAGVGEGAGALVAPEGPLACVHPCVDAHVAATAAPVATLVALRQPPAAIAVAGRRRRSGPQRRPGDQHACEVVAVQLIAHSPLWTDFAQLLFQGQL